ncbi:MAG TPA: ABC transporter ATP-binding protein [Devosiaceae bacterium]|nr:ABC transporter ATP-binding protein [Devosiaceae bacterium]
MSTLKVENLNLHHGLLHAVRDVSLKVESGEVVALVGANGAGKTTLLRAIAGAHRPSSGRISFDGRDITALPSHRRVALGIALVPEGRRLFAAMTVEENLLLGRMAGRSGDWTVERIMETFPHLEARRKARAGTLSGGEQQATAIGRALMSNPALLLLDEVSLGLSPLAVDRLYESLARLIQSGTTILLVEQDLARAMRVASRVVCLREGKVVLEGETAALDRGAVTDAYFGLGRQKVPA